MPFVKGKSGNPSGREPGSQNKLTKTVKETVLSVFNEIQDDRKVNLKQFAKDHPRDFYAIAAKLIPTEVSAKVEATGYIINYNRQTGNKPLNEPTDQT